MSAIRTPPAMNGIANNGCGTTFRHTTFDALHLLAAMFGRGTANSRPAVENS